MKKRMELLIDIFLSRIKKLLYEYLQSHNIVSSPKNVFPPLNYTFIY